MNISSDGNIYLEEKNSDDKYSKSSNNNRKDYTIITHNYIEKWNKDILNIKGLITKCNNEKGEYNEKIDDIINSKKLRNLKIYLRIILMILKIHIIVNMTIF
jgi:hypothetical protein